MHRQHLRRKCPRWTTSFPWTARHVSIQSGCLLAGCLCFPSSIGAPTVRSNTPHSAHCQTCDDGTRQTARELHTALIALGDASALGADPKCRRPVFMLDDAGEALSLCVSGPDTISLVETKFPAGSKASKALMSCRMCNLVTGPGHGSALLP